MRAILIIMLILSPLVGMSQTVLFTGSPSMLTYHKGALGADSILKVPFADTTGVGSLWPDSLRKGAIMVNSADTMLYYHDGNGWRVVAGGSADTGFIRNQLFPTYVQEGNFIIDGTGVASRFIATDDPGGGLTPTATVKSGVVDLRSTGNIIIGSNDGGMRAPMITTYGTIGVPGTTSPWLPGITSSWHNVAKVVFDSLPPQEYYENRSLFSQGRGFSAPAGTKGVMWADLSIHPIEAFLDQESPPEQTLHAPVYIDAEATVPSMDITSLYLLNSPHASVDSSIRRNIYAVGAPNALLDKVLITTPETGQSLHGTSVSAGYGVGPSNDTFAGDWALKILGNIVYKNGDEGDGKILTSSADGTVNIVDPGSIVPEGAYVQDGNAFGETAVLGTTDNEALELIAGGNTALRVNPNAKVQYLDGTEGDGKILMSSSDGTLSAQSRDSVMNGVWRSGIVNSMGTQATLRTSADTITIMGNATAPLMQAVGSMMAFNDIVRGTVDGMRFIGSAPSTGSAGVPITFEGRFPVGATGNRVGITFRAIGSPPATPTSISVIAIDRSGSPINTFIGISDQNWHITQATNNYFIRNTLFQPSSTNWFLYTQNPVKSQLSGNLLLGATTDNGHKLQVSGSIYGRNQSEPFNQFIMAESFTPTGTADASGEVGAMAWDDDYIYIKTSDGWKRSTLSTF